MKCAFYRFFHWSVSIVVAAWSMFFSFVQLDSECFLFLLFHLSYIWLFSISLFASSNVDGKCACTSVFLRLLVGGMNGVCSLFIPFNIDSFLQRTKTYTVLPGCRSNPFIGGFFLFFFLFLLPCSVLVGNPPIMYYSDGHFAQNRWRSE